MIITIDGPAGSGKSTAARKLAARLEIPYLDTGAMYRVVTLACLHEHTDLRDEQAMAHVARDAQYELDCGPTHVRVALGGHDVTEEIRTLRVSDHTRFLAGSPAVRRVLVERQREIGRRLGSMVTEGRDQGSVVFPDAAFKFYMDADLRKRAERRYHELIADGEDATLESVLEAVRERDRVDAERAVAPMTPAPDAIRVDTSRLSMNQVVELLIEHIRRAGVDVPDRSAEAAHPS